MALSFKPVNLRENPFGKFELRYEWVIPEKGPPPKTLKDVFGLKDAATFVHPAAILQVARGIYVWKAAAKPYGRFVFGKLFGDISVAFQTLPV